VKTVAELRIEAKKLGIKGFSKLTKDKLESEISKHKRLNAKNAPKVAKIPTSVAEASDTFGRMTKGEARKLRKLLRRRGRNDLAGARRAINA